MKPLLTIIAFFVLFSCKEDSKKDIQNIKNTSLSGPVFGTAYNIIYDSEVNYSVQIDSLFKVVNQSMSTYIPDSYISRINRQDTVTIDIHFRKVLNASKRIYEATNGVFDPTIGAVVNAWDFGPEGKIISLDSLKIKDLMTGVGFDKAYTDKEQFSISEGTFLDFNAIAKGYGVDVIADFLESKNSHNYLVEIGGEIRACGINIEKETLNNSWRVGIDRPRFDGVQDENPLSAISLHDVGMATSGTYRKFKIDNEGHRYAHIIDTKTGYPTKTNILSVSVIAKDCMTADAYATAFQAMGIESVTEFLKSHPELKVFIVFENDDNEFDTLNLNDFPTN